MPLVLYFVIDWLFMIQVLSALHFIMYAVLMFES